VRFARAIWLVASTVFGSAVVAAGQTLVAPALSAVGASSPPEQSAAAQTIPLTYDAAIQRAMATNPAIAAARLRRSINIASRDVAAERVNPEFRVELDKDTPKEGYTLAVPWELGGKRSRRIAVSEAAIATGEAELNQTIAQVQSDVRRAYFARFVAESRRTLLDEVQALAARARDAAQARFEAGDAPRLEVVQAQLALADAQNQAVAAQGTVAGGRAILNALLGYPLDAPTPIATTLDVGPALAVDAALARARQGNAELITFDRRLVEQRARVQLAHALRTPDIVPEGALTRRAAPEFDTGWRAALAVTLPIFTTHRAAVRVEEATLAQLTRERDAALTRISGEVASAAAIAEAQRQQYVRYRDDILPQALEVERMAEDSYRLGQTGIAAYLQALQSARDVRLRAIQSVADLQNALADLERAVGAPVAAVP
jgi:cobalt-zinc-cadmium efflux system outer membrane protein